MLSSFHSFFATVGWLGGVSCTRFPHWVWIQYCHCVHWAECCCSCPTGLLYILRFIRKVFVNCQMVCWPKEMSLQLLEIHCAKYNIPNEYGRRDHCLGSTSSPRRVAECWHSRRAKDGAVTKDSGDLKKVFFQLN